MAASHLVSTHQSRVCLAGTPQKRNIHASSRASGESRLKLRSAAMVISPLSRALALVCLVASTESYAQSCAVGQNNACLTPGAVCSPVDAGAGNQGKCKTINPKHETECACMGQGGGSSQT